MRCSFMSIVGVRFRPWTRSVCLWVERFLVLCQKVRSHTDRCTLLPQNFQKWKDHAVNQQVCIYFSLWNTMPHITSKKLPQYQWWWRPTYMAGSTALVLCQQLTPAPEKIQDPSHLKFAWNWMRRLCCHRQGYPDQTQIHSNRSGMAH
jgi:hypothetical protein